MLGLLFTMGQYLYQKLSLFVFVYSIISVILVYMGGSYIYAWLPETPITTIAAIISQAFNFQSLMLAATSALAALGIVGIARGFMSQYGAQLSLRSVAISVDFFVLTSVTQFFLSTLAKFGPVFGEVFTLVMGIVSAFVVASITVYLMFYLAGQVAA
ncbi:MAG: hypothetical protein QXQ91_05130 [Nanopusillaceae archaeon]